MLCECVLGCVGVTTTKRFNRPNDLFHACSCDKVKIAYTVKNVGHLKYLINKYLRRSVIFQNQPHKTKGCKKNTVKNTYF